MSPAPPPDDEVAKTVARSRALARISRSLVESGSRRIHTSSLLIQAAERKRVWGGASEEPDHEDQAALADWWNAVGMQSEIDREVDLTRKFGG